jgi:hypothetical protein
MEGEVLSIIILALHIFALRMCLTTGGLTARRD